MTGTSVTTEQDVGMGLDVYVGPLTRYTCGDWLTVVQQAMLAAGHEVQIVRTELDPADAINDPTVVSQVVRTWQKGLLDALGGTDPWADGLDLTYWTDKPDWDGYGGLVLLAAYDEQPELRPGRGAGLFSKRVQGDSAREF